MSFEHDYSTQDHPDKLRRLAAYHAAMATDENKRRPGWTHEASFHWEAAIDLVTMANLLDQLENERVERGKRGPLNRGMT